MSIDVDLIDSSIVIPLEGVTADTFQIFARGAPVTRMVKTNTTKRITMALCGLDVVKTFQEQEACLEHLENLEL